MTNYCNKSETYRTNNTHCDLYNRDAYTAIIYRTLLHIVNA